MAVAIRKRKGNFIVDAWHKLPTTGKVIAAGAVTVGAIVLIRKIKGSITDAAQKEKLEGLTKEFNTQFVVTSGKGQGAVVHVDLASVATQLHDALNYGVGGFFTDDESIMRLLLPIPKPYISSLEYIYKKVYGDNLNEKLRKGMWRYNYNQIRYLFL